MSSMIRAEKVFLVIALIVGVLLVFLVPPLNVADEPFHFLNAYSVSTGKLWGEKAEDESLVIRIPAEYSEYLLKYPGRFVNNRDEKYSYSEMIAESRSGNSLSDMDTVGGGLCPTGYIASATGMILGRILAMISRDQTMIFQPYNQMIFGRLGNLAFYIAVVYFALKIIPYYKRTMLLLATMPMSLFLAASLSYDAVLIPVSFLFIAITMKLMSQRDQGIRNSDIAIVLFCTFFMTGVKNGFTSPLLLLLLGIPKKKYGTNKKMIFCIAAVIVTGILGYLPQIIYQRLSAGNPVDPAFDAAWKAQREWVGQNVLKLPKIFAVTILTMKMIYADTFWGVLGWLDTPFPVPLMMSGLLILGLVAAAETSSHHIFRGKEWWKRILPLVVVGASVFGLMLAMYLSHTPRPDVLNTIGGNYVEGIQGRYFIPLFLPLVIVFSNNLIPWILRKLKKSPTLEKHGKRIEKITFVWSGFCGLFTLGIVLLRYWI